MRILTVGDDPELKTVIKEKLLRENCMVDSCNSGSAALDYLQLAEYDVVLMDVDLPDRSGVDIVDAIRRKDIQTPVMLLTAQAEVVDIVRGLDAGADEYMVKPIHFSELMARIRVLIRKRMVSAEMYIAAVTLKLMSMIKWCAEPGSRSSCLRRNTRCCYI